MYVKVLDEWVKVKVYHILLIANALIVCGCIIIIKNSINRLQPTHRDDFEEALRQLINTILLYEKIKITQCDNIRSHLIEVVDIFNL